MFSCLTLCQSVHVLIILWVSFVSFFERVPIILKLTVHQETKKLTSLQSIDVLGVHPKQLAFVMKQPDEVVRQIGMIVTRIQLFSQGKERFRVVMEIVNLKYGLSIGKVVLLKVVIKATSR